jgi:hypothetical protein
MSHKIFATSIVRMLNPQNFSSEDLTFFLFEISVLKAFSHMRKRFCQIVRFALSPRLPDIAENILPIKFVHLTINCPGSIRGG